jgi:MYXO-CTERM domain-containing protein
MAGVAVGIAPVASASIMLELSTHSSDSTSASVLLATTENSAVGATLTINVTNDTAAPDEFNINEFYFNGPDGVSLTIDTVPNQWNFYVAGAMGNPTQADGFGTFDFAVIDGQGENHPSVINPGETVSFVFTLSAPADTSDFTSALSADQPPGSMPALIAAKFVNGPGDDSAFGATVPTPGALALMGVAGLVAARPRRRRE